MTNIKLGFFFSTLVISALACNRSIAEERWIQASEFDGQDVGYYSFLKRISDKSGKYLCIEVSSWKNSSDPELRQIYLQVLESDRGFLTHKRCVDAHKSKLEVAMAAVCSPSGQIWSYDYIDKKCTAISTDCGPGIRPRLLDHPKRVFLAVYSSKDSCTKIKR
jgi:hypothetical protein